MVLFADRVLQVEMLTIALCLPQRWERVNFVQSIKARGRGRPRQRQVVDDATAVTAAAEAAEAAHVSHPSKRFSKRQESSPLPDGHFFDPSRGIAPELTAALKEAVEQQQQQQHQKGADVDEHIDIGMEGGEGDKNDRGPDGSAMEASEAVSVNADDTSVKDSTVSKAGADGGALTGAECVKPEPEPEPGPEPEPEPEPEPVVEQPFVRKAQGTWLSVESSSEDEDFGDADFDMAEAEPGAEPGAGTGAGMIMNQPPVLTTAGDEGPAAAVVDSMMSESIIQTAGSAGTAAFVEAQSLTTVAPSATGSSAGSTMASAEKADHSSSPPLPPPLTSHTPAPATPGVSELSEVGRGGHPESETTPQAQHQAASSEATHRSLRLSAKEDPPGTPGAQIMSIPIDLVDWRERVRRAGTTEELASLALELDYAVPREEGWLEPWYKTDSFPEPSLGGGSSLAAVATRVFALDRALRWNIIPRPCKGGSRLPGDLPRVWVFFNQCPLAPLCVRPCFHKGKCRFHRSGISRVDTPMVVPASPYRYTSYNAPNEEYFGQAAYAAASYDLAASNGASYGHVASPAPAAAALSASVPASLTVPPAHHIAPVSVEPYMPVSVSIAGGAADPNMTAAAGGIASTAVATSYTAQSTVAPVAAAVPAAVSAPTTLYHHTLTPAPSGSPAGGVAMASAVNAIAPQPATVAPAAVAATTAPGVVPTPAAAAHLAALNFAMPPAAGVPGLWPGLVRPQPTPDQLREFHATAEAALREAWAASPQAAAAAAAAWMAVASRAMVPASVPVPGQFTQPPPLPSAPAPAINHTPLAAQVAAPGGPQGGTEGNGNVPYGKAAAEQGK